MEHIRQYDWCSSVPERGFLKEEDIDNSVIQRIIQNKFHNPLISSDSEDETPKPTINWNQIFKRNATEDSSLWVYVPGMRPVAHFSKLSSLTRQEHFQCLKVICANQINVLPRQYIPRPTKMDFRVYEEVQQKYLAEQQEFIEWAKTLWATSHCGRALRPKPTVESVYEAEYKMKANEMECFPKNYDMAAQIALDGRDKPCQMVHQEDLIKLKMQELPRVQYPDPIERKFCIMKPCPVPEPCNKHPCWFVLPNEKSMSVLPLTEIHRELAQFAIENKAQIIASEGALKCLLEVDQDWYLPLSVCEVVDLDGEKQNVMVFGSEFTMQKEFAMARTYRAFKHLIEYTFIPASEKAKKMLTDKCDDDESQDSIADLSYNMDDVDVSSDNDEGNLFIDEDACFETKSPEGSDLEEDEERQEETETTKQKETKNKINKNKKDKEKAENGKHKNDEFYKCYCKESLFVRPPQRSYTRWQIKNSTRKDNINVIVHCAHKTRDDLGEVIIEPIVEYQLDLGGSRQSDEKLKSIALSMFLRKNAALLNVRTDNATGDVVTIDRVTQEEFKKQHGNRMPDVARVLHDMFSQLQGLLPGRYILKHETSHGSNALLFSTRVQGSEQKLVLNFQYSVTAETDEAKSVRVPQLLAPVLLPVHKFRKMLPCAFPPFENMLGREPKKPVTKKTPPQAIRWPKRSRKKAKKNR